MHRLFLGVWLGTMINVSGAPAESLVFRGMCDASAAVQLSGNLFAVASDEDNVLRFYRLGQPGFPEGTFDLQPFLFGKKKSPESDLEGVARINNRSYWITSHGRNAAGNSSPNRQQFFALEIKTRGGTVALEPVGRVYTNLLTDLLQAPQLAQFDLRRASERAPKASSGLNIEALTDTPEGGLLMGFRNPIPGGKALIVPLLNPSAVVGGSRPQFGDPIMLDLDGLGLRGMGSTKNGYYLIAGPANQEAESRLYHWKGGNDVPKLAIDIDLSGINPEAICFHDDEERHDFAILSDDGAVKIDGKESKKLPVKQREFRAFIFPR